jgi:ATP-dependent Zn protease
MAATTNSPDISSVAQDSQETSNILSNNNIDAQAPQELNMTDTEIQEAKNLMVEEYENILKVVLKFLDSIDSKLEEFGTIVGLGKLKVKDKAAVSKEIKSMRELVISLRKQLLGNADPMNIKMILNITRAMAHHLNKALENKFYELPPFNVEAVALPRSLSVTDLTPAQLQEDAKRAQEVIEYLEHESKTAGLYWYNKAFRKVDDTVSTAWKHKLFGAFPVGLTLTLGAFTAATAFYWFKYCQMPVILPTRGLNPEDAAEVIAANAASIEAANTITLPLFGKFNFANWTGKPLQTASEAITRPQDAGPLSSAEHWMSNALRHPIGAGLTAMTAAIGYYEWDEIKKWYRKKSADVYNFLRGGASNYKDDTEEKIEPRYTFKDAIGQEEIKQQLSIFVKYLEDPEHYDRSNLQPEKGILFTGDTRTGKSFMAECLAGEIKEMLARNKRTEEIGFHVISANLINKRGIAYLLELAKREAPCILFIDEIDLLRLQRDRDSTLLSEFLSTMSGCFDGNTKKMVIIIGATNKPTNIDSALLQHGRFSTQIPFTYPSFADRKKAIEKKLDTLAISPENFDLDKIAREIEGSSFKDIDVMLTKAFQNARGRGEVFSQELLEESLDDAIRKVIETDLNMPLDEQFLVAVHQTGHALAHKWIDTHDKLSKVTLKQYIPRVREEMVFDKYYRDAQKLVECGKVFTYHVDDRTNLNTQEEKINQVKILLAGNVAEKIVFGSTSFSYHRDDKQQALNILKGIVYQGIKPEELSKSMNNKKLDEACAWLEKIEAEVTQLFEKRKDELMVITQVLQHLKSLTSDEIDMILEYRKQELAGTLPKELMDIKAAAEKEMQAKMQAQGIVPAAPKEVKPALTA